MAFWQLVLLAAPCLVGALPTAGPVRRGLLALPSAHRAARHRLSALPLPSVDELTSLSTAIGGAGAHVPHVLDGIASTLSTLSTLTVADNPSVNPIAFIEQGERNVGIGFMQQVCSGLATNPCQDALCRRHHRDRHRRRHRRRRRRRRRHHYQHHNHY